MVSIIRSIIYNFLDGVLVFLDRVDSCVWMTKNLKSGKPIILRIWNYKSIVVIWNYLHRSYGHIALSGLYPPSSSPTLFLSPLICLSSTDLHHLLFESLVSYYYSPSSPQHSPSSPAVHHFVGVFMVISSIFNFSSLACLV